MSDSFGARLREQRERRQIALADLAEQTKISLSLLEGLERDDVSHWPSGIFRRSFVRAYAHIVGLDADAMVREFLERYPDPLETSDPALRPVESGAANEAPPTRLRYLVGSVIGSLARARAALPTQEPPATVPARAVETARIVEATPRMESTPPFEPMMPSRLAMDSTAVADSAMAIEPSPAIPPTPVVEKHMATGPAPREPDLPALARLCTELGQVLETRAVARVLEAAGELLDASGLIVWIWDARTAALRPALAYGYPSELLAKMPGVAREAKNATAAAFRMGETRIVDGAEGENGAVVVPLLTATGCGGVLAVELRHGGECLESVRALATILAAQLAAFVWTAPLAEAVNA
jgi:transcriptional regulator with XRE-family HTH domain